MQSDSNPILQQLGQYLRDTLQMELLNTGRISSEALFDSIESVVDSTMEGVVITAQGLFYAKYVNAGRRAGVKGIPLDVLTEWIRCKKLELHGKRAESVAFAMQLSIKQKGIHPAPFIDRAVNKFEKSKMIENKIERFMSQYLDQQLQTMFNQLAA